MGMKYNNDHILTSSLLGCLVLISNESQFQCFHVFVFPYVNKYVMVQVCLFANFLLLFYFHVHTSPGLCKNSKFHLGVSLLADIVEQALA